MNGDLQHLLRNHKARPDERRLTRRAVSGAVDVMQSIRDNSDINGLIGGDKICQGATDIYQRIKALLLMCFKVQKLLVSLRSIVFVNIE